MDKDSETEPEAPHRLFKDTTMQMDRRDFIKIVFGTTSVVLLQGAKPPAGEVTRFARFF